MFPEPLLADAEFADWVEEEGIATYARFLLTHPWSTLTEPLEDFVADRPSFADPPRVDETMLSTAESYGAARQVVPEPSTSCVFDPGGTGTSSSPSSSSRRHGRWRRARLGPALAGAAAAIVLQWPALTVVWHASTAELGRLALVSAVALRIGLIAQSTLVADGWFGDRHVGA